MVMQFHFSNYCASFLDLLGQRDSMKGQGLLLLDEGGSPRLEVKKSMAESVGKILSFQSDADNFLNQEPNDSIRDEMDDEEKLAYDDICKQKMKRQRWSDGLVLYTSMNAVAPMFAIYEVMYASACLCFQQLAKGAPIRGGIDISWGAELHENELYGAIVANSYALENDVAQYPRIVVGDRVLVYLEEAKAHPDVENNAAKLNKALAKFCRSMLVRDIDGYMILDYLSPVMIEAVGEATSRELLDSAIRFAQSQYYLHSVKERNSKLAARYNWLLSYLENKKPRD